MRRRVAILVLAILALGAGAIVVIHLATQPGEPWSMPWDQAPVPSAPATVSDEPPPPGQPPVQLPPPEPGEPVAPPVVHVGPAPRPMSSDPQRRADELLELRRERFGSALEQQNRRSAAKLQRQGVSVPPAPDPADAPRPAAPTNRPPSRRDSLSPEHSN